MEHVWVNAYVDYRPSRGARHRKGDSWIPMDASFKQYQFTEGMDIQDNVSFDAEGFVEQLTQNSQINETEGWVSGIDQTFMETSLQNYQTQIEDYITQTNPEATVGDVLGIQTIIPSKRPTLAASLPYRVVAKGNKVRELPASFRLQFRYNLYSSETERVRGHDPILSFQDSLPNLASKRMTLSFEPASDADRELIESYLPEVPEGQELDPATLPTSLPGYLIKLKAELKIDGEVVQSGGYFSLGQELSSASAITIVPGRWLPAYDKPIAGEFYAIGIDGQGIGSQQLEKIVAQMKTVNTKLETQPFDQITKDEFIGTMLHAGVLSYFAANDEVLRMVKHDGKALSYRLPSFGTFSTNLKPSYFFGIPQRVKMAGIRVNIDFLNKSLWATDNDLDTTIALTRQIGIMASALEHRIPEILFTDTENEPSIEGVSAVKALIVAAKEGQSIYQLTSENVDLVLPVLNVRTDVKDDIRDAVQVGKMAIVSQNQITISGWTGVGYIITDPRTGAGAYLISGGYNGAIEKLSSHLAGAVNVSSLIGMLPDIGLGVLVPLWEDIFEVLECYEELIREAFMAILLMLLLLIILAGILSAGPAGTAAGPALIRLLQVVIPILTVIYSRLVMAAEETVCCPENAPYGAYYRYETEEKWFIQALATNFLWGNAPLGGDYPTIQAYRKDHSPHKLYRYGFCTEVAPASGGGPIVQWYGEGPFYTPGVIMDNGAAKIPIVIITSGPKL